MIQSIPNSVRSTAAPTATHRHYSPNINSDSPSSFMPTSSASSLSSPPAVSDLVDDSIISPSSSTDAVSSDNPLTIPFHPSEPSINPVNVHAMQTRAKSDIIQPRLYHTLLLTHTEPTSVSQALAASHWFQAMNDEYQALLKN